MKRAVHARRTFPGLAFPHNGHRDCIDSQSAKETDRHSLLAPRNVCLLLPPSCSRLIRTGEPSLLRVSEQGKSVRAGSTKYLEMKNARKYSRRVKAASSTKLLICPQRKNNPQRTPGSCYRIWLWDHNYRVSPQTAGGCPSACARRKQSRLVGDASGSGSRVKEVSRAGKRPPVGYGEPVSPVHLPLGRGSSYRAAAGLRLSAYSLRCLQGCVDFSLTLEFRRNQKRDFFSSLLRSREPANWAKAWRPSFESSQHHEDRTTAY